jgi:hypothetical protein
LDVARDTGTRFYDDRNAVISFFQDKLAIVDEAENARQESKLNMPAAYETIISLLRDLRISYEERLERLRSLLKSNPGVVLERDEEGESLYSIGLRTHGRLNAAGCYLSLILLANRCR